MTESEILTVASIVISILTAWFFYLVGNRTRSRNRRAISKNLAILFLPRLLSR